MNAIDKLLNFGKTYRKEMFDWSNSILYDFLTDHYGLHDVSMKLENGDEIIIKKYNVVGSRPGDDYIVVHESSGELDTYLYVIQLSKIVSVTALF